MADSLLDLEKKITDPAKYSVQSRAEATNGFAPMSDVMAGGGLFWVSLGQRLDEEPRWNPIYPNWRDRFLLDFSRSESMAASAVYSMKTRIGTLNYELNGPPRAKKFSQELLKKPGLADSLSVVVQKLSSDLDTSDNGAFLELWRAGNPEKAPPKGSPVLGFGHLDSRLCWRSFDPEFPVWYTNPVTGKIRKLHKDRVIYTADNPQPVELARGIGFCSISRALRMVRVFRSMEIFADEKLSGRFVRAIGAISGVSAGQVKRALENHRDDQDSKGYVIYNEIPFLIDPSTEGKNDIKILLQDLAGVPDGFNFRDSADLYAYILAFCFGVDAREFWPATQSGATKADATVQNMKARGRGIGNRIQTIEYMLRAALPETVTFEYDFTDDDQDKLQAEIRQTKVAYLGALVRDGAITNLEERAIAIADGIIDGALLESLELPMDSDSNTDETEQEQGLEQEQEREEQPPPGNPAVPTDKALVEKTVDSYRRALRQLVRGYWNGTLGAFDFNAGMADAIDFNFHKAWNEGMKAYGIAPEEITDAEATRLRLEIATQISYIGGFAQAVAANSKANGGALYALYDRLELWVKQYGRIVALAGVMAAADAKSIWVFGDTTNHCPSCSAYAGLVYRNSVWNKWLGPHDMLPRGKGLACGGWQCDCSLKKTSEPVRPGHPAIVKVHLHANAQAERDHAQTSADDQTIHAGNGSGGSQNGESNHARHAIDHAHMGA